MMNSYVDKTLITLCFCLGMHAFSTSWAEDHHSDIDQVAHRTVGHQTVLTITQERQFGDLIMRQLRAENSVSQDLVLNAYLQHLGDRIAAVGPKTHFHTTVFGIRSKDINAFTFFGGYIGVHEGLLLNIGTEQELIAVLAHEFSHITQRHLARMTENNRRMMPLTMAEMLAAMALGSATSPEVGMHAILAVLNMHFHKMLTFSREHEQEADRQGIGILAQMEYDPRALMTVFQGFSKAARFSEKVPEYLQSHPLNESRIADAANRTVNFPKRVVPDSLAFQWIMARTRVQLFEGRTRDLITQLKQALSRPEVNEGVLARAKYAYALALLKDLQYAPAIDTLTELQEQYPSEWILGMSLAEAEYLSGRRAKGFERLTKWLRADPRCFPVGMLYSDYAIKEKKPALAKAWLKKFDRDTPCEISAYYQLLAQTNRLLGDVAGVHRAQAEWHLLRGDVKSAKLQIDLALDRVDRQKDMIELYKIEAVKERIEKFKKQNT